MRLRRNSWLVSLRPRTLILTFKSRSGSRYYCTYLDFSLINIAWYYLRFKSDVSCKRGSRRPLEPGETTMNGWALPGEKKNTCIEFPGVEWWLHAFIHVMWLLYQVVNAKIIQQTWAVASVASSFADKSGMCRWRCGTSIRIWEVSEYTMKSWRYSQRKMMEIQHCPLRLSLWKRWCWWNEE